MMATTDSTAAAYEAERQALQNSTERLLRVIRSWDRSRLGRRRPVGSPADYRIPGAGERDLSHELNTFDRTAVQLHLNALAHYVEAYWAHHGTGPKVVPGDLVMATRAQDLVQRMGARQASLDLAAFKRDVAATRCEAALRAYELMPNEESRTNLLLAALEAQNFDAVDSPEVRRALEVVSGMEGAWPRPTGPDWGAG